MIETERTTFLAGVPTALDGFAQVLGSWSMRYHRFRTSPTNQLADRRAAAQDWAAVVDDLVAAIGSVRSRPR